MFVLFSLCEISFFIRCPWSIQCFMWPNIYGVFAMTSLTIFPWLRFSAFRSANRFSGFYKNCETGDHIDAGLILDQWCFVFFPSLYCSERHRLLDHPRCQWNRAKELWVNKVKHTLCLQFPLAVGAFSVLRAVPGYSCLCAASLPCQPGCGGGWTGGCSLCCTWAFLSQCGVTFMPLT